MTTPTARPTARSGRPWRRTTARVIRRDAGICHLTEAGSETLNYSVDPNGCWIWNGSLSSTGYGHIKLDGRARMAHRWVYETTIGPIAAGHDIDHLCRVKACVNPAHLEPVLPAINCQRGKRAKLTAEDVAEIRATYAAGRENQPELATRFGVNNATISRTIRGERWPIQPAGRRRTA